MVQTDKIRHRQWLEYWYRADMGFGDFQGQSSRAACGYTALDSGLWHRNCILDELRFLSPYWPSRMALSDRYGFRALWWWCLSDNIQ